MQNMTHTTKTTKRDPGDMEIARMIVNRFFAYLDTDPAEDRSAELLLAAFQESTQADKDSLAARVFLAFAGGVSAGMEIYEALEQKSSSARLRELENELRQSTTKAELKELRRERREKALREKWRSGIDEAFLKTARNDIRVRPVKMAHALGVTSQTVRKHVEANDNPGYFFADGYVYSLDRMEAQGAAP